MSEFFRDFPGGIINGRVGIQFPRIDAKQCQAAGVGIGNGFENNRGEGFVFGRFSFFNLVSPGFMSSDGASILRRGKLCNHQIHQHSDTDSFER